MKFDEKSHRQVVRDLQRNFQVELRKIGRARNYLVDGNGVRYIVLGGGDCRPGISRAIVEEEEQSGSYTLLVVAMTDPMQRCNPPLKGMNSCGAGFR